MNKHVDMELEDQVLQVEPVINLRMRYRLVLAVCAAAGDPGLAGLIQAARAAGFNMQEIQANCRGQSLDAVADVLLQCAVVYVRGERPPPQLLCRLQALGVTEAVLMALVSQLYPTQIQFRSAG